MIDLHGRWSSPGIARSRNHAYNTILAIGLREARRLVERRRAVKKLLDEYMAKRLPFQQPPTARDVEAEGPSCIGASCYRAIHGL